VSSVSKRIMDTNNSGNKARDYVTRVSTVVLCGTSRLPKRVIGKCIFDLFSIEVEVEPANCKIVNLCCTTYLPFVKKMLQKSLIGYEVEEGIQNGIEEINAKYFSNTKKAVIAALRNLSVKYVEHNKAHYPTRVGHYFYQEKKGRG